MHCTEFVELDAIFDEWAVLVRLPLDRSGFHWCDSLARHNYYGSTVEPFIGTTVGTDRSGPIRGVKIALEYVSKDSGGLSVGRGGPIEGVVRK